MTPSILIDKARRFIELSFIAGIVVGFWTAVAYGLMWWASK